MANRIQYRRDTAANWTAANPILAAGEPGLETDTKKSKIGDGTTAWVSLGYQAPDATTLAATYATAAGAATAYAQRTAAVSRLAANISFSSTTFADLDPSGVSGYRSLDLVVAAAADDLVDIHPSFVIGNEARDIYFDAVTMNAGTPINPVSGSFAGSGVGGWFGNSGVAGPVSGAVTYLVKPEDVIGGVVRFRSRARVGSAGSRTIWSSESWPLRMSAQWRGPITPVLSRIIFDGDSQTADVYGGGTTVAAQTLALLTRSTGINYAVGGQTLDDMTADAVAQIDGAYPTDGRRPVVAAWGGTNNLKIGETGAATHTKYSDYLKARKAAGFTTLAVTMLPRSDAGVDAGYETQRQAFNTAVRTNWRGYADRLVDLAADTRIGDAGDETNTTYFHTDLVHLNNTGRGIVAAAYRDALNSINVT